MGKILNVFIKQHQRGRWRYLSLFICISLLENAFQRVPNFTKKTLQKLTALYLLSLTRVRKRMPA